MRTSTKGLDKVTEYVKNRVKGIGKVKSAELADYSEKTAHKPANIEKTNNYQLVSAIFLQDNAVLMLSLIQTMRQKFESENYNIQELKVYSETVKNLSQIHKNLSPEVKIKDVKQADGTTRRTIWATGSVENAETIAKDPLE